MSKEEAIDKLLERLERVRIDCNEKYIKLSAIASLAEKMDFTVQQKAIDDKRMIYSWLGWHIENIINDFNKDIKTDEDGEEG